MNRWVLLIDGVASPRRQMDRDRELFSRLRKDFPNLLRVYRMDRRGATVGRTHRAPIPNEWQVDPENIAVRPTGGGGVLHENDLCFSLLIPWKRDLSRARDWPSFYESLHRILADFLPFAGISPSLLTICPDKSDRMTGTSLRSGLCFYDPVRGDVMMEGRKILGGALAIGRNGVLYQGSLCVSGKDPVILSSFFEKWYCAEGRVALEKALVEDRPELAGRGRGSFETFDTL